MSSEELASATGKGLQYRLEFEYLSPFTGKWEHGARESTDLVSLVEQWDNQLQMQDVRHSQILYRTVSEWSMYRMERLEGTSGFGVG